MVSVISRHDIHISDLCMAQVRAFRPFIRRDGYSWRTTDNLYLAPAKALAYLCRGSKDLSLRKDCTISSCTHWDSDPSASPCDVLPVKDVIKSRSDYLIPLKDTISKIYVEMLYIRRRDAEALGLVEEYAQYQLGIHPLVRLQDAHLEYRPENRRWIFLDPYKTVPVARLGLGRRRDAAYR
jgi:hypothetical protein